MHSYLEACDKKSIQNNYQVGKVRRTEQCELSMFTHIKLNFYELAAGSVCLHAIS